MNASGSVTSAWVDFTRLDRERTHLWSAVTNNPPSEVNALLVEGAKIWVGANQRVFAVDSEGHDWPESGSDTEADVTALASGNRLTVVVTKKGQVRWTADGLSWTVSNALTNHALNSISFQKGIFVAVGADQTIHVSSDLISWKSSVLAVPTNPSGESESNPEPVSFNDVAVGLGRFVVVGGYFRSAEAIILTSTDAQHWSPHLPLSGKRLRAVHFAAGMFVGVGNEGEVVTSEDGEIWTRRMSGVRVEGYNFRDIAYWSGRWAAVGTRGILCTSRDGRIWTVHHLEYLDTLQAAAGVGDRLLVAGERGVLWFSSPAASRLNWTTPAPLLTVTAGWLSSTQLERSTDLRTWEPFREVTGDQETVRIEIVPLSRGNEFFRALDAK